MKNQSLRHQIGISLLEILIAVVVLSAGLLGLAGLQVAGLRTSQNTTAQQQATLAVYGLLEKMRGNRQAALAGSYSRTTPYTASLCDSVSSVDCRTNACTGAQIAQQDIRDIMCGSNTANGGAGGLAQNVGASLTITCASATDCSQGIQFDVVWTERSLEKATSSSGTNAGCNNGTGTGGGYGNCGSTPTNNDAPVSMKLTARL